MTLRLKRSLRLSKLRRCHPQPTNEWPSSQTDGLIRWVRLQGIAMARSVAARSVNYSLLFKQEHSQLPLFQF